MMWPLLRHVRAGLRSLARRGDVDRELDDELQHFIEMSVNEKVRSGMSRADAERQARVELGGVEVVKENVRSAGWESRLDSVMRDVRLSVRRLVTSPTYTIAAVAMLGLGITVTTTELTVANTVLRQRWAVRDPSRVFTIISSRGGPSFSPIAARYLAANAKSFAGIIATRCLGGIRSECRLSVNDAPAEVDFVSGNYFSVLGVGVAAGRGFVPDDDRLESPTAVAVVSAAFWRSRLGADPAAVGKSIRVDDVPFTVVGIATPEFTGTRTERNDLWLPMSAMLVLRPGRREIREQLTTPSSERSEAAIAGRLVDGVTPERARAELATISRSFALEHRLNERGVRLVPTSFFPNPAKTGTAAGLFASMFIAVLLVLLLACANVGNLLLARAAARGREIAVRLALGASRRRLVRQLLMESLLLAGGAGVIGVGASFVIPTAIMTRIFGSVSWRFAPDAVVLSAALFLVLLTCIAFGLAPALHATRADVASVLRAGEVGTGGSASTTRIRGVMLAVQIAISLMLLVDAGLLVRGIQRGRDLDPGFRTKGVVVLSFDLPASDEPDKMAAFNRELMAENRAVGSAAAFAIDVPFESGRGADFRLPGDPFTRTRQAQLFEVSSEFFNVLGLSIVAGRPLRPSSDDDAILVNESLARTLWQKESPLGKVILDGDRARHVVGIVRNASLSRLDRVGDVIFRPIDPSKPLSLLLQSPSIGMTDALGAMGRQLDRRVTVRVDSLAGGVERQLEGLRATAVLAGILGIIALVIAAAGVFGVFAYVVQRRTREIGIRTALGASPRRAMASVVRESIRSIVFGLLVGAALGIASGRLIASAVYGISAFDPVVLGFTALLLILAGLLATWIPARRVARIDPVIALRAD